MAKSYKDISDLGHKTFQHIEVMGFQISNDIDISYRTYWKGANDFIEGNISPVDLDESPEKFIVEMYAGASLYEACLLFSDSKNKDYYAKAHELFIIVLKQIERELNTPDCFL